MSKVALQIIALTSSESAPGQYAVLLEEATEAEHKRRLSINIGQPEAQAIALVLENLQPDRPQTHDLLYQTLTALNTKLAEVCIYAVQDDQVFAQLMLNQAGQTVVVEARPSDALALAVRSGSAITTHQHILDAASFNSNTTQVPPTASDDFLQYTIAELEELLQEVLANEDYQSAGRIRDAIRKRKEA